MKNKSYLRITAVVLSVIMLSGMITAAPAMAEGQEFEAEAGLYYYLAFDGSLTNNAGGSYSDASGNAGYVAGISGQAALDPCIILPDNIFGGIKDYSISAWFKTPVSPSADNKVFSIGNDAVRYMYFKPSNSSGFPEFVMTNNGIGSEQKLAGNFALAADTWYHVLVTQRSEYSRMYINGVEAAQLNETAIYPFEIGGTVGNAIVFNGAVDEFKIYDRYLDRDEAASKAVLSLSDAEAVALIKNMVNIPAETKQKADLYTINGDISLTWSSENTAVISNTGWVTRPETTTAVTLTATITKGSAKDTAVFTTLVAAASDSDSALALDFTKTGPEIMDTLFGAFFEDINWGADAGLYPEKFTNRSFEYFAHIWNGTHSNPDSAHNRTDDATAHRHGWMGVGGADFEVVNDAPYMNENNKNYVKVTVPESGGGLLNYGYGNITGTAKAGNEVCYPGMNFKKGDGYTFSMWVRGAVNTTATVTLYGGGTTNAAGMYGENTYEVGQVAFHINTTGDGWQKVSVPVKVEKDVANAEGLTSDGFADIKFADPGVYYLDFISLYPHETYNNRENGLRKDLVEILKNMNPGFLRFPGGCVSEGVGPDNMYNWKKTVGPIEERQLDFNMWCENLYSGGQSNTYYYQSFGLGYYEYMLLCEDLEMAAMPVMNAGIACELRELATYGTTIYRGGVDPDTVDMEGLQPYIDDALDFIEFCNGDPATSKWATLRAEMGHPEPFDLLYLALGNEQQNGPTGTNPAGTNPTEFSHYSKYYHEFEKQIHAKYPYIRLISSSGRGTSGTGYQTAYNWILKGTVYSPGPKGLDYAWAVDEHGYYNNEATMYAAYDRYDPTVANYLRGDRPYVFFGEYSLRANQRRNYIRSALAEAALMAGFEKNSDIVAMASYAPLFAKDGYEQWTPDAIWSSEYTAYGSAAYYNQKMFANHIGDYNIPNTITYTTKSVGDAASRPYSSVMFDHEANEIIIRAINPIRQEYDMKFSLDGVDYVNPVGRVIQLGGSIDASGAPDNTLSNTLTAQRNVYDREFTWDGFATEFYYTLKPYSSVIFRISLNDDSKMVSYVPPVSMTKSTGVVPVLPEKVDVVYADGSAGQENVNWEFRPDCFYDREGEYKVYGDVENTSYKAIVLLALSDSPSIIYYTENLTVGCAANIKVKIGNPAAGLSVEVTVDGKRYPAYFEGDTALIRVPVAISTEGKLTLRLMDGDVTLDSKEITMNKQPADLWNPTVGLSGDDLRIMFSAEIAPKAGGYAATLNGNAVTPVAIGNDALNIKDAALLESNKIVVSGVKYPMLFPSYSFTFALSYDNHI